MRLSGGGGSKKRGRITEPTVALCDIVEKPDDPDVIKTCFRTEFDERDFLNTMSVTDAMSYCHRIENNRATDQVAAATVEFMATYVAVKDYPVVFVFLFMLLAYLV
jgi:hypothetical protein